MCLPCPCGQVSLLMGWVGGDYQNERPIGMRVRPLALPCEHMLLQAWHCARYRCGSASLPAGAGEQTLVFEVWDAAARGGRGASLGCGRLAVPVRSLQHREEHTAELSWEAPAAPADTAGGSGSGAEEGSSPAKAQEQQQGGVRLQLSYMLQKQWSFAKSGAGPAVPDSWGADASTAGAGPLGGAAAGWVAGRCRNRQHFTCYSNSNCGHLPLPCAGQRALSLASHPGSWAVVPAFGQQKGGSGGVAGGASSGAAGG